MNKATKQMMGYHLLYKNYFIQGSKQKKKKVFRSRLFDLKPLYFNVSVTACISDIQ